MKSNQLLTKISKLILIHGKRHFDLKINFGCVAQLVRAQIL